MTQAQQIAERYDNDGQRWVDGAGVWLTDALEAARAKPEMRPGSSDCVRHTLPDGSVITTAGDGWDFGYPDCWCWQGSGHEEDGPGRCALLPRED